MELSGRKWKEVIYAGYKPFSVNLPEIWQNRDLLFILMRRDILAIYKQTILGPLWFLLQPVLTTITFIFIFSRGIRLSTAGIPPALFYLSGLVLWSYFSECVVKTSTFLKDNTPILSKVYFPRLIIPLSLVMTNLVKFAIQFVVFLAVYIYFLFQPGDLVRPDRFLLLVPALIVVVAILGFGIGLFITALTTKYKDLSHLTIFGVQLLLFASPVIFPLSSLSNPRGILFIKANPMTGLIEAFRFGFFGSGVWDWPLLGYDFVCATIFLFTGLFLFNAVERSFVDSI